MSRELKVISIKNTDKNKDIRFLVLQKEIFDWGLDDESLLRAKKLIEQKPDMRESVIMSIINHFVESFSDFLGREITLEEIIDAVEKGKIK